MLLMLSECYLLNNNYQILGRILKRKRKIKNKHNDNYSVRKIIKYKKMFNVEQKQWVSTYDVYKVLSDIKKEKKNKRLIRIKGNDYKCFTHNEELYGDLRNLYGDNYWFDYAYLSDLFYNDDDDCSCWTI